MINRKEFFMEKKKSKILIIIAVVLVIVMSVTYSVYREKESAGNKAITVKVIHLNGDTKSFSLDTDEEYLGDVLEKEGLTEGENAEYGMFITTVDGEKIDEKKEQWWGYTVNGEMATNGVDTQPVENGDNYEFQLNEGY